MKKLFVIALGFLLVPQANAQPAVLIAEYRFDTLMVTPPASSGLYGTSYRYYCNPLVLSSAGNFYQGGLTTVNGGYFTTGHPPASITNRGFIGANWTQTLNTGKYMGFSLTPVVGQTLVIDSISQWSAKSNVGPDTTRMRFGPFFPANSWYTVNVGDISWKRSSRTTGLPSSSSTIHVRYYTYHNLLDPNPAGTWRIDEVKVYGHLLNVFNLPIELTSFTGHKTLDGVELNWTTASELDNDYFTLLRCPDTESWEAIGNVDGAGNSTSSINYSFVDENPLSGINYYQLEQTDTNGDSTLSHVVAVDFQNVFTLTHQVGSSISWDDKYTMVLDVSGRSVSDWQQSHTLSTPGIYFLADKQGSVVRLNVTP